VDDGLRMQPTIREREPSLDAIPARLGGRVALREHVLDRRQKQRRLKGLRQECGPEPLCFCLENGVRVSADDDDWECRVAEALFERELKSIVRAQSDVDDE
jgi:hypothetical protein